MTTFSRSSTQTHALVSGRPALDSIPPRDKRVPGQAVEAVILRCIRSLQHCVHECWTHAQELATAVSMGIDLTVLILNDDAYGMIKWKQVGPCDRLACWSAFQGGAQVSQHRHALYRQGRNHEQEATEL